MRVGVGVGGGGGVNVNVAIVVIVGTAACVSAIAVWMACGDGEQAASKNIAKHMIMVMHFLFILSHSLNVYFLMIIIAQLLTICSCNLTVGGNIKVTTPRPGEGGG